jgi:hypothetical protein
VVFNFLFIVGVIVGHKVKVKVPTENGFEEKQGQVVEITQNDDIKGEYTLEDGTIIRVRAIVVQVVKVDDMFDALGNPAYQVQAQPIVSIIHSQEQV